MAKAAEDDLKNILANGNALIVCGAGVSAGLTGGKAPGWKALVEKSVAYAKAEAVLTTSDEDDCKRWLEAGTVTEQWLKAAELVRKKLGIKFRAFLGVELDGLVNTSPVLSGQLKSFLDAGNAIATTNYDNLLAAALGVRPVTWVHAVDAMKIVKGQSSNVLHLHGHWTEPNSVVFCETDYQNVTQAEDGQFVQKLAIHNRSLVFIGCSLDGLSDANMGNLMKWFDTTWKDLGEKHYVLCLEKDMAGWPSAVSPVVYGKSHADLAPFLQRQAPVPPEEHARLEVRPHMVGRQGELRQVVDWLLADNHPIIISGDPGMGKSALALEVAHHAEIETKFGKERYFLRLDAATDAHAMVSAAARRLGVEPKGGIDAIADAIAKTRTVPTLLVLDNLETPWQDHRDDVENAIARMNSGRNLHLVLTIRGETPDLVGTVHKAEDIAKLNTHDATAFFLRGLQEKFKHDPDLPALIAVLDGHPLSIMLMAAQADAEAFISALLQRWNTESARMLLKGAGDHRLNNLLISVTLSFDKLSPEAKRLVRLVARLPAGLALWMAREILGDTITDGAARELLKARLAKREGERLTMLSPLKAAVLELPVQHQADEDGLRGRLLAIAGKGQRATQHMSDAEVAEIENLDAALLWAIADDVQTKLIDDVQTKLIEAFIGLATLHRLTGRGSVSSLTRGVTFWHTKSQTNYQAHCILNIGSIAL
jgi:SIR2-like domain